MGEPKAFKEIARKDPGYRPREQRLRDFRSVERLLGHDDLRAQASRCMDCGTPFCHAYGCPLGNVIPEFNEFVYRGRWPQAVDLLLSTNNFPEFTGRVCPAPCEAACVAGLRVDAVTIRQIELAIIEKGFENDCIRLNPPGIRREGRIAVVGAGPAGLAVADTLNHAGYRVVVYDEAPRPGGILRYGIPDFKLEKWVIDRRLQLMENQGVVFETGVRVGEDVSYHYLQRRFDAVCLACGAREPRDLDVPGRRLEGVHFAMDYLTVQNRKIAGEYVDPARDITARGKRVVIIGGGDTGSDCLGTALRQGAGEVHQLEILPMPPEKRSEDTPWPMWPLMLRRSHAHLEGGTFRWSVTAKEFLGDSGRVTAVRCAEVEWRSPREGASPVPVEKPGTEFQLKADLVLLSMGFVGPEKNRLVEGAGIALDERGTVRADERSMTGVKGLFVAGDMNLGQSLVVKAIADGQKAAREIAAYLSRTEGRGQSNGGAR